MPAKKKITEKTDKRRRAKIKVGDDIDGRPVYKYASGKTNKELAANADELRKKFITGNAGDRRNMLFGAFVQEWYDDYKKPRLSEASKTTYAAVIGTHLNPEFSERQLRAITAPDLQKFMNSKQGMSKSSVDKIYMVIKQIFASATAQSVLDRDPSLSLMKPFAEEGERRALNESESKAALAVASSHPEGLLILLLYYTGARIGEILGLQWCDVDFNTATIRIERDIDFKDGAKVGKLKTQSSYRSIPIPAPLYTALDSNRGIGKAFILQGEKSGSSLSERTLKRRWRRLMRAMYLMDESIEHEDMKPEKPSQKKIKPTVFPQMSILTPHYFRHNYASLLYNADVDVLSAQRWLGHSDIKTTLGIYSHLSKGKEDINVAKMLASFAEKKKVAEKLPE